MNNYCTNCGKKLKKDELVCEECNTPIIDLPIDYNYKSPESKKRKKKILKIIGICMLFLVIFLSLRYTINSIKVDNIKNKYVIPYLKSNYNNEYGVFKVQLYRSGKCKTKSCFNAADTCGCGAACCFDEYLEDEKCKAYTFEINDDKYELVTVFYKDNRYHVIRGESIDGNDYERSENSE